MLAAFNSAIFRAVRLISRSDTCLAVVEINLLLRPDCEGRNLERNWPAEPIRAALRDRHMSIALGKLLAGVMHTSRILITSHEAHAGHDTLVFFHPVVSRSLVPLQHCIDWVGLGFIIMCLVKVSVHFLYNMDSSFKTTTCTATIRNSGGLVIRCHFRIIWWFDMLPDSRSIVAVRF